MNFEIDPKVLARPADTTIAAPNETERDNMAVILRQGLLVPVLRSDGTYDVGLWVIARPPYEAADGEVRVTVVHKYDGLKKTPRVATLVRWMADANYARAAREGGW